MNSQYGRKVWGARLRPATEKELFALLEASDKTKTELLRDLIELGIRSHKALVQTKDKKLKSPKA
jgi:hypothetical protein